MRSTSIKKVRIVAYCVTLGMLVASIPTFAQDPAAAPPQDQAPNPGWSQLPNQQPNQPTGPMVPSRLTLQAGTFVTVRVDQMLSSEKNVAGDGFSASLARPLIVDGIVVARRGQIVGGRVAEAQKAGHVSRISRLAVELTDLTLVDGQQVLLQTELTSLNGPSSNGRDVGAVVGTTATGAAVGAIAGGGPGAAIGAGAGAIVGSLGVLITHGRPTIIYPESILTFRLASPVAISTDRAPQAFLYANAGGYNQPSYNQPSYNQPYQGQTPGYCSGYGCPPPPQPYYYPPVYYPYYYPYYWGPSFTFWYGGRGFYGPRFYGGFRR